MHLFHPYKSFLKALFSFSILLCLTSCLTSNLAVYTDYLSHENLASYVVDTPDPHLNYPPIGQRLIVTWTLKNQDLCHQDLHLLMSIRYRNKKEITLTHPITRSKGTYVYALLNQDYIEADGILTYKVELIGDGLLLDEWRHQMWVPLIQIGESSPEQIPEQTAADELDDWPSDR